jgi:hypothetical protein
LVFGELTLGCGDRLVFLLNHITRTGTEQALYVSVVREKGSSGEEAEKEETYSKSSSKSVEIGGLFVSTCVDGVLKLDFGLAESLAESINVLWNVYIIVTRSAKPRGQA